MRRWCLVWAVALSACRLSSVAAPSQPGVVPAPPPRPMPPPSDVPPTPAPPTRADFGDAPDRARDGGFPTLRASEGPFHQALEDAWIGVTARSDTTAEDDALLVDQDFEGVGVHLFLRVFAVSIPAPSVMAVAVNARPPHSPRYLNIAVDVNRDGRFGGGRLPEWVLHNHRVDWSVARALPDGTRRVFVATPWFHFSDGAVLSPRWTRVTLSPAPVQVPRGEWDGSGPPGGFADGETEDHLLSFGPSPKTCVMRMQTEQPLGTAVNVVRMVNDTGTFFVRVTQLGGDCPPLPPPDAPNNFRINLVGPCRAVVNNPVPIAFAPAPPWLGIAPAVAGAPGGIVANWTCPAGQHCVARCPAELVTDPDGEMLTQPTELTFVQGEGNVPMCGNGRRDEGEGCDDGNLREGDGCSSLCQPATAGTCGNGRVDPGEECDTGREATRGCSRVCLRLGPAPEALPRDR